MLDVDKNKAKAKGQGTSLHTLTVTLVTHTLSRALNIIPTITERPTLK